VRSGKKNSKGVTFGYSCQDKNDIYCTQNVAMVTSQCCYEYALQTM